jgi:hypothetical protein
MTALPQLDDKTLSYVLETIETVTESTDDRRTGQKGEEQAKHLFLNELMKYCDDTQEQYFHTHPGAGTLTQKILCALLIICAVLFSISVSNGYVATAVLSLLLNLGIFAVFSYKFIFDGTKLDIIKPRKNSANILGRRFPQGIAQQRVVFVAHTDAPLSIRSFLFGNMATYIVSICSLVGNTLLFCSQALFLFNGAPIDEPFFRVLRGFCLVFLPFYVIGLFLVNPQKTSSGISSSLMPSSIILSILKQFSEDSFRYEKTEFCCLITGSEYSGRAGSYAFAKKYRRLFSDIPTVFIPIEEITTSDKLSVFFKDGSGNKGSAEIASIIAQAAENLSLELTKENTILGSASFTPFAVNHFPACSLGTSKKHISKSVSPTADKITTIRRKTVSDIGALIIEILNYYDS